VDEEERRREEMPRYSLSDSLSLQWDRGRRRRKKETGSEAGMEEKRRVSLAEDREIEDALYSVRCYQPRYWYLPFHCTKDSQRGRILAGSGVAGGTRDTGQIDMGREVPPRRGHEGTCRARTSREGREVPLG
jgi:hypothetical protein